MDCEHWKELITTVSKEGQKLKPHKRSDLPEVTQHTVGGKARLDPYLPEKNKRGGFSFAKFVALYEVLQV